jgi:hypothetical protein
VGAASCKKIIFLPADDTQISYKKICVQIADKLGFSAISTDEYHQRFY